MNTRVDTQQGDVLTQLILVAAGSSVPDGMEQDPVSYLLIPDNLINLVMLLNNGIGLRKYLDSHHKFDYISAAKEMIRLGSPFVPLSCGFSMFQIALILESLPLLHYIAGSRPDPYVTIDGEYTLSMACRNERTALFMIPLLNDMNMRNKDGSTPAHRAAELPVGFVIRELHKKGADFNVVDLLGETPLDKALKRGGLDTVKALIDCGANPDTNLEFALENNRVEIVEYVWSSSPQQYTDNILIWLCRFNVTTSTLLNKVAFSKETNYNYRIDGLSIWSHCIHNKLQDFTQRILKSNADPNFTDRAGTTPLYHALANNDFELADAIIKKGGTVFLEEKYGSMLDFGSLSEQAVRYLFEHGFKLRNDQEKRAIFRMIPAIVQILIEKNAYDENILDLDNRSLLEVATPECLSILLKAGVKNNINKAFKQAVEAQNQESVEILLKAGVAPNGTGDGPSPLYIAASMGNLEMVKTLLNHGANPRLKHDDKAPSRIAELKGYIEVAKLLKQTFV